jgi:hypothetical protein
LPPPEQPEITTKRLTFIFPHLKGDLDETGSFTTGNFLQSVSDSARAILGGPVSTPLVVQERSGAIMTEFDVPLIIGESYPPFKDGLPDYVKLQNVVVPKKLASAFIVPALTTDGA